METKTDLVSIGMPVYNGANYIKEALESLLSQDYGNFELIISDNASTDSTQSICLEYLEKDSRIKYFRNQVNEGGLANFNKVLELSSGKYFMWAAHDDLWEINYITELVKLMDSDPNNVLAFSCLKSIDMNSSVINSYPHIHFLTDSKHCVQLSKYITAEEYLGKANLIYGLMRKDKIQEIGGLTIWGNTDFGSDMLFVFRLLGEGRLVMSSEFLFFKRIINNHVQTASNSNISFMSQITQSLQELNLWIDYFQGYLKIITIINVPDKLELYLVTVLRALRIVSRLLFSVAKKMIFSRQFFIR
jgi:glycosyltransferase involved in cell wall biosynthesis